jgi:hypothetical protein
MERKLLRRRVRSRYDKIEDFCAEVGATTNFMSTVFTGEKDPSFNLVRKMGERLDIRRGEIGDLFFPEVKE